MYRIVHEDERVEVAADPYAKAVTANGQRTAIIDLNTTHPEGWENDVKPSFYIRLMLSSMNYMYEIFF